MYTQEKDGLPVITVTWNWRTYVQYSYTSRLFRRMRPKETTKARDSVSFREAAVVYWCPVQWRLKIRRLAEQSICCCSRMPWFMNEWMNEHSVSAGFRGQPCVALMVMGYASASSMKTLLPWKLQRLEFPGSNGTRNISGKMERNACTKT
jgi:hypothetical protein